MHILEPDKRDLEKEGGSNVLILHFYYTFDET